MYLITFHSNFDANLLRKRLKDDAEIKLKPVPRELSSSCGTCVSFVPFDKSYDINILNNYSFEKVYLIKEDKYEMLFSKE